MVLCRHHSPAGVSEYEVQAHLQQLPPTVHHQLHCFATAALQSVLQRVLQARAASDGEYESAAAVCWRVPVQKYKLQAATETFLLKFLLQIWPVGGADAQPSPLNIALFALLARTSKDDGFAAKLFELEKI